MHPSHDARCSWSDIAVFDTAVWLSCLTAGAESRCGLTLAVALHVPCVRPLKRRAECVRCKGRLAGTAAGHRLRRRGGRRRGAAARAPVVAPVGRAWRVGRPHRACAAAPPLGPPTGRDAASTQLRHGRLQVHLQAYKLERHSHKATAQNSDAVTACCLLSLANIWPPSAALQRWTIE